jgi:hypothetical protein
MANSHPHHRADRQGCTQGGFHREVLLGTQGYLSGTGEALTQLAPGLQGVEGLLSLTPRKHLQAQLK